MVKNMNKTMKNTERGKNIIYLFCYFIFSFVETSNIYYFLHYGKVNSPIFIIYFYLVSSVQ